MQWDVRDIAPSIPSGKNSSRTFASRTAAMQAIEAALAGGGMTPKQRKEKERADRLALGLRRRELYAQTTTGRNCTRWPTRWPASVAPNAYAEWMPDRADLTK